MCIASRATSGHYFPWGCVSDVHRDSKVESKATLAEWTFHDRCNMMQSNEQVTSTGQASRSNKGQHGGQARQAQASRGRQARGLVFKRVSLHQVRCVLLPQRKQSDRCPESSGRRNHLQESAHARNASSTSALSTWQTTLSEPGGNFCSPGPAPTSRRFQSPLVDSSSIQAVSRAVFRNLRWM